MEELNKHDLEMIKESLNQWKYSIEHSQVQSNYESKIKRLEEIDAVLAKVREMQSCYD